MGWDSARFVVRPGCQVADLPRDEDLQRMRFGFGAKAGREQLISYPSEGADNPEAHDDDKNDQFRSHGDTAMTIQSLLADCHRAIPVKRKRVVLQGETSAAQ